MRNIIVLTNADYADVVRENLPELPANNVIAEPAVRDTAGAIGLAATVLTKSDQEATMAIVTADQLIEPAELLQQAIKDAFVYVNSNPESLITFGIQPTFANTHLGYIKCTDWRRYEQGKTRRKKSKGIFRERTVFLEFRNVRLESKNNPVKSAKVPA
ncbi:MAG: sugar phosphate nucleotidyltransferase [Planctomycetota bacterium]